MTECFMSVFGDTRLKSIERMNANRFTPEKSFLDETKSLFLQEIKKRDTMFNKIYLKNKKKATKLYERFLETEHFVNYF